MQFPVLARCVYRGSSELPRKTAALVVQMQYIHDTYARCTSGVSQPLAVGLPLALGAYGP